MRLKLQSSEQFVERELQPDEEFAEFAVIGANRIETHLVDDRLNLESILGEKGNAPLGVVDPGGTGDELLHLASVAPANGAMAEHKFAALFKRQPIPVVLFAAAFAHVVE